MEERRIPKWISLAEVIFFYALVMGVIWLNDIPKPAVLICALLLVLFAVLSNIAHKDTLERVGLRSIHFRKNLRLVSLTTLPIILPLIVLGVRRGAHPGWDMWFSLLGYPVWAFAQEYALLAFVGNRLEEVGEKGGGVVPWINGFLFGMAHLPNPVLMCVTFVGGAVFTWIYFKERHLIPITIAHTLMGVLLSLVWGDVRGIMSVGPAYLNRIGNPWPILK